MKTKYEYVSKILVVTFFMIASFVMMSLDKSVQNEYKEMMEVGSKKNISTIIVSSKPRIVKVPKPKKKPIVITNVDTSDKEVLATFGGTVSHYGPDCVGCSGVTASGYKVKNTIYYQDPTYGTLRIVAADRSIPLGSVLRLNTTNGVIHAIVLDRGGGIGFNKKYVLDLLCESEKQSYQFGIMKNTKVEVLRYGY